MKHEIKVTFHTHGLTHSLGRDHIEKVIKDSKFSEKINNLQVNESNEERLKCWLRSSLDFLEDFCELDPVGAGDDNCSVKRAEFLRNEIYRILE